MTTDVVVQILSASSHVFMDLPSLFTGSNKNSKSLITPFPNAVCTICWTSIIRDIMWIRS